MNKIILLTALISLTACTTPTSSNMSDNTNNMTISEKYGIDQTINLRAAKAQCEADNTKDLNRDCSNAMNYEAIRMAAPRPTRQVLEKYNKRNDWVLVSYTVDTNGETKNIKVLDRSQNASDFVKASIDATKKFKYKPYIENGEAVEIPNVINRFKLIIE